MDWDDKLWKVAPSTKLLVTRYGRVYTSRLDLPRATHNSSLRIDHRSVSHQRPLKNLCSRHLHSSCIPSFSSTRVKPVLSAMQSAAMRCSPQRGGRRAPRTLSLVSPMSKTYQHILRLSGLHTCRSSSGSHQFCNAPRILTGAQRVAITDPSKLIPIFHVRTAY